MTRSLSLAFVFTSLIVGCTDGGSSGTTLGDDELGGENGQDGETAKADGIDTFGIYTAQKVGAYECNGAGSCTHVTLARPNRTTTLCADGKTKDSCDVRYLDFSKLGLSSTKLDEVSKQLQASAADPSIGAQLLVRGKYIHGTNPLYPTLDWVTFQVTELWSAQISDGNVDGTFVMVSDNGKKCFEPPCSATTEARVNSTRTMDVDGLDWSAPYDKVISNPSYLPNRVRAAMNQTDGAIVVGYRTHGTIMHLPTTLRSVEQVFLRVK
jgi:hypothetical protein